MPQERAERGVSVVAQIEVLEFDCQHRLDVLGLDREDGRLPGHLRLEGGSVGIKQASDVLQKASLLARDENIPHCAQAKWALRDEAHGGSASMLA